MKRLIYTATALIGLIAMMLIAMSCTKHPAAEVTEETTQKVEAVTRQTTEETITEEETTNDRRGGNPVDTDNDGDDADPGTDRADTAPVEELKTAEELMEEVLNKGIDGPDREEFLGERYDEVQRLIDEKYSIEMPTYVYDDTTYVYQPDTGVYYGDGALNPEDGVNYYGGVLETYYDLDMSWCIGVMRDMGYDEVNYPYWIRSDGVKMLGDYVMCAADFSYEPRGTITSTSLGTAIVVDTGLGGWGWHDICVSGW